MNPEGSAWDFANPCRIICGVGRVEELSGLVETPDVLVVTTPGFTRRGLTARIKALLTGRQVQVIDDVTANPTLEFLEARVNKLWTGFGGTIVSVGGGSAIDVGKVLGFALPAFAHGFSLRQHFRTGTSVPAVRSLPVLAIPTTAGTGSEVTPFATVWDPPTGAKFSLASPALRPDVALLDPELTVDLPRAITVAAGLDAISQALESIWNRHANQITMALAEAGLRLGLESLPRLLEAPADLTRRQRMLEASLLAGLAISRTRTALAHSISYPLTAHHGLPHGIACSFTLPSVLRFNAAADDGRLRGVAARLGGNLDDLAMRLQALLDVCAVRQEFDARQLEPAQILALASEMSHPGRADNNLRAASVTDIREILREACEHTFQPGRGIAR